MERWADSGDTQLVDLSVGPRENLCPVLCTLAPSLSLTQSVPVISVEEESPRAQDWKFTGKVLFVRKEQDTELLCVRGGRGR